MFQFPPCPAAPYVFRCDCPGITLGGLPHSETPGSKPVGRLTGDYRSLTTSFIGSWRQGIHRIPLVA